MRRLRPIHIAYGLVGCFFALERMLRRGETARSLQAGAEDRGSTRAIGSAFGAAIITLLIAPSLNRFRIGRISSEPLAWSGVALMLVGLLLRVWASRTLGSYYTRTLRIEQGQHLITEGPYRLVRNPGYLGVLLLWLGAGLATANGIATLVISVPLARAYLRRMDAEETLLTHTFPQDYPDYARHTRRLIPFIY